MPRPTSIMGPSTPLVQRSSITAPVPVDVSLFLITIKKINKIMLLCFILYRIQKNENWKFPKFTH
jgi:hypothetical protein